MPTTPAANRPTPAQLDEAGLNAWPALATVLVDGVLVRLSRGFTRRANSASLLYPGSLPAADHIQRVEQLYLAEQLRPIFRLRQFPGPAQEQTADASLDQLLAVRGYQQQAVTQVLLARLDSSPLQPQRPAALMPDKVAMSQWLQCYGRLTGLPAPAQHIHGLLLKGIPLPRLFAVIHQGGDAVACVLGVLDGSVLGLFDLVTAPQLRRQGLATALLQGLAAWGRDRGASHCWLQVDNSNHNARNLYRQLGFQNSYSYWYRVADPESIAHKPQQ